MRSLLISARALLLLTAMGSSVSSAAMWTVTSTADSGPGTLRTAIDSANASAAARDTIAFNIAGAGPHSIALTGNLPPILKTGILIDGYTQPGAVANSLASGNNAVLKIELALTSVWIGLSVDADSCTFRGLVITGGLKGIELTGSSFDDVIEGNFIGVDVSGTIANGNQVGIDINSPAGNLVGGTTPAARNIISGNTGVGIVAGNSKGNIIQGNYIGTDKNGTSPLGNASSGIDLTTNADSNLIGGTTGGARNVISGNLKGITIFGSTGNVVQGNFIGTDRSGTAAMGNTSGGIEILNSPGNTVEGATSATRNVISCNTNFQIRLSGNPSVGNLIVGNLIGTDATGLVAFSNPGNGIELVFADSNFIGQSGALRNIIGGMATIGIDFSGGADANIITGNSIGVGLDGTTPIPNGGAGIVISASSYNQIGDLGPFQLGNVIANATGAVSSSGIRIPVGSVGNTIFANSIYGNAGLGIDLHPFNVTPNDSDDVDTGPNDRQNFPVLSDGLITATGTYVVGTLNSEPSASYFIQVFGNASCDSSGYGEGRVVIDTFTVMTDVSGDVSFSHNMLADVGDTVVLTATATNPNGSTSEFSACVPVVEAAVADTLRYFLFSPVHMVITDPVGDSIGIDSASNVIFNTILNSSSYDTTTDLNSSDLSGPDGSSDDVVTIPNPIAGDYVVRLYREEGAEDTLTFTMGIRIDGNQMITPDDYFDTEVSALGTTVSTTFVWTAATTLPGDCNADGNTTAADIIYLVNFVFKSGPETVVSGHGDVNCTGTVTSADVIYLVNYVFKSGLSPCSHTAG